jgi:hypothetical protein
MPRMMENFRRSVAELDAAGVPLLALARASLVGKGPQMTDYGIEAELATLPASGGLRRLATRQVFAEGDARQYFFDGTHWTREGHERMARALLGQTLSILGGSCRKAGETPAQ